MIIYPQNRKANRVEIPNEQLAIDFLASENAEENAEYYGIRMAFINWLTIDKETTFAVTFRDQEEEKEVEQAAKDIEEISDLILKGLTNKGPATFYILTRTFHDDNREPRAIPNMLRNDERRILAVLTYYSELGDKDTYYQAWKISPGGMELIAGRYGEKEV